MNGALEFYDLNEVTLMNVGEHFTATDVEWDPSGRYVSTSVSWWAHKVTTIWVELRESGALAEGGEVMSGVCLVFIVDWLINKQMWATKE